MSSIYVVKRLDGKTIASGYASRQNAKVERDRLIREGVKCVVSRGDDHPRGASEPDQWSHPKMAETKISEEVSE
jgi:hypothetical protein